MNVEDSYEGAVRRLRRLGHAVEQTPTRALSRQLDQANERMRDLEELATLACDENERLTQELDTSREEIDRLVQLLTRLQAAIALSSTEAALPARKRRGHGAAFYLVLLVLAAGAVAASSVLRPWEHVRELRPWVQKLRPRERMQRAWALLAGPAAQPRTTDPAPVERESVEVDAPAPQLAPVASKVAPVAPEVGPPVAAAPTPAPAAEPRASEPQEEAAPAKANARAKPHRVHIAKHHPRKSSRHAANHTGSRSRANRALEAARSNDPLAGLSL